MEEIITEKEQVTIRTETRNTGERIFGYCYDSIVEIELWWYNWK